MTNPEPTVRRAIPADSEPCYRLFLETVADLTARLGSPWEPDAEELWPRIQPLYDRLSTHAAEWWVAEDAASGELLGYARSLERGGLFELTEFFVRPGRQSSGVGKRLLARAFPPGRGEVRSIIATTDMRAQARYYAAGTVARFPIAELSLTLASRAQDGDTGDLEPVPATDAHAPELAAVERAVLEFDRGADEFRWLLSQREGYLYRRNGEVAGFGFIGRVGSGPVAALSADDQPGILTHLEARARALGREQLSFEVPMVNSVAMRHLLSQGYVMDPLLTLLMSSRPFGHFDRFIGFAPPFVL